MISYAILGRCRDAALLLDCLLSCRSGAINALAITACNISNTTSVLVLKFCGAIKESLRSWGRCLKVEIDAHNSWRWDQLPRSCPWETLLHISQETCSWVHKKWSDTPYANINLTAWRISMSPFSLTMWTRDCFGITHRRYSERKTSSKTICSMQLRPGEILQ